MLVSVHGATGLNCVSLQWGWPASPEHVVVAATRPNWRIPLVRGCGVVALVDEGDRARRFRPALHDVGRDIRTGADVVRIRMIVDDHDAKLARVRDQRVDDVMHAFVLSTASHRFQSRIAPPMRADDVAPDSGLAAISWC